MARKKIVFVIVEGASDAEALDAVISRIFDKQMVYVHIAHGDITSNRGTTASNVVSKIAGEVMSYAKANHFEKNKKTFFQEILHIVDMDGAYIPDDHVVADQGAGRALYSETGIKTSNKPEIERRNQRKKTNIDRLSSCKEIWGLPYRVFYMSCNLDHVLYNKLNTSDREKEEDSFQFAKKYKGRVPEFLSFLSDSGFSVMTGYRESWEYIKEGLRSLERHTNLGLCFRKEEENQ